MVDPRSESVAAPQVLSTSINSYRYGNCIYMRRASDAGRTAFAEEHQGVESTTDQPIRGQYYSLFEQGGGQNAVPGTTRRLCRSATKMGY